MHSNTDNLTKAEAIGMIEALTEEGYDKPFDFNERMLETAFEKLENGNYAATFWSLSDFDIAVQEAGGVYIR